MTIKQSLSQSKNTQENPRIINNLTNKTLIHNPVVFNESKNDFKKSHSAWKTLEYHGEKF